MLCKQFKTPFPQWCNNENSAYLNGAVVRLKGYNLAKYPIPPHSREWSVNDSYHWCFSVVNYSLNFLPFHREQALMNVYIK